MKNYSKLKISTDLKVFKFLESHVHLGGSVVLVTDLFTRVEWELGNFGIKTSRKL